jgi:hypothetical protein
MSIWVIFFYQFWIDDVVGEISVYMVLDSNTFLSHGFRSGECMADWKLRGSEQPPTFSAFLAVCNCEWLIRVHDVYIRGNNSVASAVEGPSCQSSSSACGS